MSRLFTIIAFIGLSSISWSQEKNFSEKNLKSFAEAYMSIRNENMTLQLNMLTAIEDAGLTSDEFTDIHMLLNDPNADKTPTDADKRKYNVALNKIEKLKKGLQKSMEDIIKQNGLDVATYNSIAKASQNDSILNDKVQKYMN